MKPPARLLGFLITIPVLLASCTHQDATVSSNPPVAKVQGPDRLTAPPPSEWPFPNYHPGPLNPPPIKVNFYAIDDNFPAYLLCEYPLEENSYDPASEPGWLKPALQQMRKSGAEKFPPIDWMAVSIVNRAGYHGKTTMERSFKAGALFKASDVFDQSRDLSLLVAQASTDHHPFKLTVCQTASLGSGIPTAS